MRALTHDAPMTHGALSEFSVSAPTRKGREGKGREKEGRGTRVETSHHIVTYVPANLRVGVVNP